MAVSPDDDDGDDDDDDDKCHASDQHDIWRGNL